MVSNKKQQQKQRKKQQLAQKFVCQPNKRKIVQKMQNISSVYLFHFHLIDILFFSVFFLFLAFFEASYSKTSTSTRSIIEILSLTQISWLIAYCVLSSSDSIVSCEE